MIALLLTHVWFTLASGPDIRPIPSSYVGRAYDLKTGELVYSELHQELREDGKRVGLRTDYVDALGTVIARRSVSFAEHETIAEFRTEDMRSGYVEGSRVEGSKVTLFTRKDLLSEVEEKEVTFPGLAAVDAGFNNLVQSNWDRIMAGETVKFHFGVPFALDYFRFRITKENEMQDADRTLAVVLLEIESPLLRVFVKPIRLTYDAGVRRLVEYAGISNINDENGKSYSVRIVYEPYGP